MFLKITTSESQEDFKNSENNSSDFGIHRLPASVANSQLTFTIEPKLWRRVASLCSTSFRKSSLSFSIAFICLLVSVPNVCPYSKTNPHPLLQFLRNWNRCDFNKVNNVSFASAETITHEKTSSVF